MNGQVFPLFEYAHILRIPMLTELRDYAFEYGRLIHEGYSNGIVGGCAVTATNDTITLNRGVIRYGEQMYLIVEPITLPYYPTDVWTVFKLEFKDEARREGYIYRAVEASLCDNLKLRAEEMEICRFKLKQGARLRIAYIDFADRATEFDTVITLHVPYSAYETSSLSPAITRAFAKEAIPYATEALDTAFLLQALNAATSLPRETLLFYIAAKRKRPYAALDNQEIFAALREILNGMKADGEREIIRSVRARRQIIVD